MADKDGDGGDSDRAKRKRTDSSASVAEPQTKRARLASDLNMTSAEDIEVLEVVQSKYDIQTHSVLSSSKIQQKVTSILRHLTATNPAKPRVTVLRARAADAGKLITIAEISKREIPKDKGDAGQWFQYIGLGEETRETPQKKDKSKDEGKTIVEDTVLGGITQNKDADEKETEGHVAEDDDEDDDDFEIMKAPLERGVEAKPPRPTPIMSIFISRVSIKVLKRRYGEQTNFTQSKGGK